MERYSDEKYASATLLCAHLRRLVARLRTLSAAQWDVALTPSAPTPRMLVTHIYQWLICDRQHIEQADIRLHLCIPDAPQEAEELCRAMEEESDRWEELLLGLTPEQLLEPRAQFGDPDFVFNVRGLVIHTLWSTL